MQSVARQRWWSADSYVAAELVAADIGENTVNWRHSVYQDLYNVVHW